MSRIRSGARRFPVLSDMAPPVAKDDKSGLEMPFDTAPRTSMPLPKSILALKLGNQWSNLILALSSITSPVKTEANCANRAGVRPQ